MRFLLFEGAKISLRFLDLRQDEMMKFGGKNSLSKGDDPEDGNVS